MPSFTRRDALKLTAALTPILAPALAAPALLRVTTARAASWPDHAIRCIVPFSAGSTTDIIARIVMESISPKLGQTIIVENRGGAGGTIGAQAVNQAAPDGYTLLVASSGHTATPVIYPKTPFDPAADFSGVALFGSVPNVTLIAPSKGIKSLAELVAASKKSHLTFASSGAGSATHWAAERLRIAAGIDATHVPFRGGPEALTEVMTGRVDFFCVGVSSGLPFIRDGKLTALAVSTRTRASILPEVPTTLELGYPNSDYTFWNGLLVSSKTPPEIVKRLNEEVAKALATPEVKERLAPQGNELMPLTPPQFDAMMRTEIKENLALAKAANLTFN
jgi:tripartite-type tricarboxylate transporter receptor subunit TctC